MLRFGTDGIRGVANLELTPELVLALGRAAGRVLPAGPVVIGRDTRWSGPLLEASLTAGLVAEGRHVVSLGVVPTPAVAHACAVDGAVGAMISASHNPYPDNGIKLFLPGGRKLPDAVEEALEREMTTVLAGVAGPDVPRGDAVGTVTVRSDAVEAYVPAVTRVLEGRSLDGVRVVLDVAHGAAVDAAPRAFEAAGAEVVDVLHAQPDGRNINDACGSTDPSVLAERVVAAGADLGLAFDGDADRLIAVDASGRVVDGDRVIAICALDLRARGALTDDTVVVTVMSNLGFHRAMSDAGIGVVATAVGDRNVLDALDEGGWSLGGEQSGHVIFRDLASTGDGILTGLALADVVARTGRPLSELAAVMQRLPQVLVNVAVHGDAGTVVDGLAEQIAVVAAELGDEGRVLVRASGTEPLVRVMVEAMTEDLARRSAEHLAELARASG